MRSDEGSTAVLLLLGLLLLLPGLLVLLPGLLLLLLPGLLLLLLLLLPGLLLLLLRAGWLCWGLLLPCCCTSGCGRFAAAHFCSSGSLNSPRRAGNLLPGCDKSRKPGI
jgi:hypothetical protein